MFEVITQSQPLDWQSLEILKEAYTKLGKQIEMAATSKRIAQAYVQLGQLSSAILEYESILQRYPDDPDVKKALGEIETKASSLSVPKVPETDFAEKAPAYKKAGSGRPAPAPEVDDGRQVLHKIFVEGKLVSADDFNRNWPAPNLNAAPAGLVEPFIHALNEKQLCTAENSLKALIEKSRCAWLPLEKYDVDVDLVRSFPREICHRWCILPFDRMGKSVLVATCNPFNKQAALDMEQATKNRLIWYLATPGELVKMIKKILR